MYPTPQASIGRFQGKIRIADASAAVYRHESWRVSLRRAGSPFLRTINGGCAEGYEFVLDRTDAGIA